MEKQMESRLILNIKPVALLADVLSTEGKIIPFGIVPRIIPVVLMDFL